MERIPHEFDYRKKTENFLILDFESTFEFINGA